MAFKSILESRISKDRVSNKEWTVTCSRHFPKKGNSKLVFSIGAAVREKLGWRKSDLIDVLKSDDDNSAIIRRATGKSGIKLAVDGKGHGVIRISGIPGEGPKKLTLLDHQIIDNEIMFDACWN